MLITKVFGGQCNGCDSYEAPWHEYRTTNSAWCTEYLPSSITSITVIIVINFIDEAFSS